MLLLFIFHSLPPAMIDLFIISTFFPLSRFHVCGIRQYVPISDWLLSLSSIHLFPLSLSKLSLWWLHINRSLPVFFSPKNHHYSRQIKSLYESNQYYVFKTLKSIIAFGAMIKSSMGISSRYLLLRLDQTTEELCWGTNSNRPPSDSLLEVIFECWKLFSDFKCQ